MSPSSNLHNTNFYYLWNEKRYGRKVNTTIPHFARLSKKSPVVFQILKHTGYRFLSNLQSSRAGGGLSHAMSSFQGLIEPIRRWENLVIKKRKDG